MNVNLLILCISFIGLIGLTGIIDVKLGNEYPYTTFGAFIFGGAVIFLQPDIFDKR